MLTNKKIEREKIICRLAEILEKYYISFINNDIKASIEEYKKLCVTLDKEIEIIKNTEHIKAYAFDVTDRGELMAKKEDGTTLTVSSGEVSVRGIFGYN